jgi:Tfp pilus assembly protein PilV
MADHSNPTGTEPLQTSCTAPWSKCGGLALIEVTFVLVIVGVLVQSVLKGQEFTQTARVRDMLVQQAAVEQAVFAFQDRYRAMPGDYDRASTTIPCSGGWWNGNGNGRVEVGTHGAIHEDLLAWQHMSDAGFLRDRYVMEDSSMSDPLINWWRPLPWPALSRSIVNEIQSKSHRAVSVAGRCTASSSGHPSRLRAAPAG